MDTITLSAALFNEIMDMAKKNTDPKSVRATAKLVFIEVSHGALHASATNGNRACHLMSTYPDNTTEVKMIIPVMPRLNRGVPGCNITATDKEIIFETPSGTTSTRREDAGWFDIVGLFTNDEPKETVYFDPKNLVAALSVFDGDVEIKYHGRLSPLVITQNGKRSLVCPVHPKNLRRNN